MNVAELDLVTRFVLEKKSKSAWRNLPFDASRNGV